MATRNTTAKAAANKPDFAALLDQAKLPEATVPICMRADLVGEHEALDRQLERLLDKPITKFGGDGRGELKRRIEALEAEMEEATYQFWFRAMPRVHYRRFVAAHPPRKTTSGDVEKRDAAIGVNADTFLGALVRRCCIDPILDEASWRKLLGDSEEERDRLTAAGKENEIEDGVLTDRQIDLLADAAWGLNRRDVDIPFSDAVSRLNESSEPG